MEFSTWHLWNERNSIPNVRWPGVYAIALSSDDLKGSTFSMLREVIYIGMSNAVAGLRGRLEQFDKTIAWKRKQHGGADRVLFKHRHYAQLCANLYVSISAIQCDTNAETPSELRKMGLVASNEFEALAQYAEAFQQLPEFNRQSESKKYSLAVGWNICPTT